MYVSVYRYMDMKDLLGKIIKSHWFCIVSLENFLLNSSMLGLGKSLVFGGVSSKVRWF